MPFINVFNSLDSRTHRSNTKCSQLLLPLTWSIKLKFQNTPQNKWLPGMVHRAFLWHRRQSFKSYVVNVIFRQRKFI